jgi:hypothetical protein
MSIRILTVPALLSFALLAACSHKAGTSPSIGAPEPMTGAPADMGPGARKDSGVSPAPTLSASPGAPGQAGGEKMAQYEEARNGSDDGDASVSASPTTPPSEYKPGLGTSYGEQRFSSVRTVRFRRANSTNPAALLSLRYNDAEGVRQISQLKTGGYPQRAMSQSGVFTVTLRDEAGSPLPGAQVGSDVYAVGETGARYVIGIENNSNQRYEVLASVDGLDVIDGQEADFTKRGYLIDPYTSFVIEGWRTSDDTVAAFRFSDMDNAYAERMGKGRNIGVVGVAFFHEEGVRNSDDLQRRDSADPFPNRYAPPPPGYRANGY